ncbi:uncharacterized protein BX664DRAFT_299394 [Halteromyces radiatus]|uniref:uncharacterized protein n=1 Tax=Halteromyces radiatus TaxID=101107 RepID=UPI00222070D1|nr:uncharacterized protein BX664DRAFT_299394 [Halteromyces radiatus]KAI8086603.1 hypothetical protein BX664DRAFT_299394 [Halteromyces radiatus]
MAFKDIKKAAHPQLLPDIPSDTSNMQEPDSFVKSTRPSVKDETLFNQFLPKSNDLETEHEAVYHWNITDWKSLEAKTRSPAFQVGDIFWRILLFPKGNNQNDFISVYLEVSDPVEQGLKDNWHHCAQFTLVVSNPEDPTNYYSNNADHRFSQEEVDWGFTRFYDLKLLQQNMKDGKGPFLINNQITISVFVRLVKDETGVLWHNFVNYDSRKETGYVGMKNQGATCYMNSLLQSLYCTNLFRKAVYQIPTENDEPTNSVALALQRCFYNLQHDESPIGTTELTKSFGWDSVEAFMQHDVQEFNRVLQDNLEVKMKGTPADGAISDLFEGKMKSYVKCINVDYESSRVEDFYDIQLNVKGCKNLYDSFQDYVAMETLEGENKYHAEGFGFQDANKGVIFESFPPVLHLQLKRFEYDYMRDTMVKINDRHEFPEEINLDEFVSKDANRSEPYDYVLHGVLVHSGDLHSGHYFALIKTDKEGKWLRFDDDRVTPVTKKEVFEENFGDDAVVSPGGNNFSLLNGGPLRTTNNSRLMKRFTNAYMLVYIQRSKLNKVLAPVLESDIPEHLKQRITEERVAVEKKRKDKEEMHLYVKAAVLTDELFEDRQEFDLATFDDRLLQASPGVEIFKVLKSDTIASFKDTLVKHYKLDKDKVRLWNVIYRTNETVRVDQPFTPDEERGTMERLRENSCTSTQFSGFAKLYLEHVASPAKLLELKSDDILIFIKYFDVQKQKIRGLGHTFVKSNERVGDLIPTLNKMINLPSDTSIDLYEEVKPSMIDKMNLKQTFHQSEIQHGDIICFQISVSEEKALELQSQGKLATVRDHYRSVLNRVMVLFKHKFDKRDGKEVKLVTDRFADYTKVVQQLAEKLDVDWSKIRLTSAHAVSHQPKEVIPFRARLQLSQMAFGLPRAHDYVHAVNMESIAPLPVIYYEILDVSMADLESKKTLQLILLGPGGLREETTVAVFVPSIGTVTDIISALDSKKCKLDISQPELLRLYEVMDGKITKEFSLDQPIDNVGDKRATLYLERIPDDELLMDMDNDRLIQVVHYNKDPSRLHSVPFRFTVKKGELFDETKKRLQQRLGYGNKEWQKVKFSVIKNIHSLEPELVYLEKDDLILRDTKIGEDDALGLEHIDKTSKTGRFGGAFERGIFIRG